MVDLKDEDTRKKGKMAEKNFFHFCAVVDK